MSGDENTEVDFSSGTLDANAATQTVISQSETGANEGKNEAEAQTDDETSLPAANANAKSIDKEAEENPSNLLSYPNITSFLAAATPEGNNKGSKVKVWHHIEEVFLIGCVMDRFFKRGSLASKRAGVVDGKPQEAEEKCWISIKKQMDRAWVRFQGRVEVDRTAQSLARHYKVMKAKLTNYIEAPMENFRQYFVEWETVYNVKNHLMLGEEDYKRYMANEEKENNISGDAQTRYDTLMKRQYEEIKNPGVNAPRLPDVHAEANKKRKVIAAETDKAESKPKADSDEVIATKSLKMLSEQLPQF